MTAEQIPVISSEAEAIKPEIASIEDKVSENDTKKDFASNFEKISKQEKHNSEIRKQLEEKRKAFETDKADLERYRQFDQELKADPLSVLEKLGLSYDKIQRLVHEKQNPGNAEARYALESVRKLEAELKESRAKEESERLSQQEIRLNAAIAEEVKNGGFDVIEQLGQESAVREFMETYYEETGEIPEIKFACEAIAADIASKVAKISKSKWLQPKEPSIETKEAIVEAKSLSNKMTQSSTKEGKPVTEEDRIKAAERIMRGM